MDLWVTQWNPKVQSTSSRLVKTPEELWEEVQNLLKDLPDEYISVIPAD